MAGYYYTKNELNGDALVCWQQAWPGVLNAIPSFVRDPDDAACNGLFNGFDFLSNWLQDVEVMIEKWPQDAQGYVVWADLLSLDAKRFGLQPDIPAAQQLLLRAKMRVTNAADWDLDLRIRDLRRLLQSGR